MITAKRTTDQRRITRNSSHYKKVKTTEYVHTEPSDDQVPWNFEAGIGYLPESEQRVEEESSQSSPNQSRSEDQPPTLQRSGRSRR
jgi:hypothetical protein